MDLANCPQCGKVYVKNIYSLCPTCIKEIEGQYQKCADYLRKNRTCTMQELSEGTGVSVKQIIRFIREGRISTKDAPNVLMPCEVCGEPMKTGTICENCRSKLAKDVNNMKHNEKRKEHKLETEGAYLKDGFTKR